MSKNVIGICGVVVFLCGVFLPFMGLQQSKGDILPLLMSLVCMIVAGGFITQAIKPRFFKYYALTTGVGLFFSCIIALIIYGCYSICHFQSVKPNKDVPVECTEVEIKELSDLNESADSASENAEPVSIQTVEIKELKELDVPANSNEKRNHGQY